MSQPITQIDKTAVIYNYYERNKTYRDNLIFFLANGLNNYDEFYIVVSGEMSAPQVVAPNVQYIFRANKNLDYGGCSEFANYIRGKKQYRNYLFVNVSARGPFIPNYEIRNWVNCFSDKLVGDIHCVASSLNINSDGDVNFNDYEKQKKDNPITHAQTIAYMLSSKAFEFLQLSGFYVNQEYLLKDKVIHHYELGMSYRLLKNGMNITSILPLQDRIDYINGKTGIDFSPRLMSNDLLYRYKFLRRSLTPIELIFIKTNRNMLNKLELSSYTFSALLCADPPQELKDEVGRILSESYEALFRENYNSSLIGKITNYFFIFLPGKMKEFIFKLRRPLRLRRSLAKQKAIEIKHKMLSK